MADWERANPWRQGHVLCDDAVKSLGLARSGDLATIRAVVVSHDCDLAASPDKEPQVEIIVGTSIENIKGDYSHAKNARRLHLEYQGENAPTPIELTATSKAQVLKEALLEFNPRSDLRIDGAGRSVLQTWLAARYRRAAFPDEFERRLKAAKLHRKIARALGPAGQHVIAVFLDVDAGEEITRQGVDDLYKIGIYLLYDTSRDEVAASAAAKTAAELIEVAFDQTSRNGGEGCKWIELLYCDVISDQALSYSNSRKFKQWRLDHLSLDVETQQPMLDE